MISFPNPLGLIDWLATRLANRKAKAARRSERNAKTARAKWGKCQKAPDWRSFQYRITLHHESGDRSAISKHGSYWFWETSGTQVSDRTEDQLRELQNVAEVVGYGKWEGEDIGAPSR